MKLMSFVMATMMSFAVVAAEQTEKPTERGQLDFGLVPFQGQRTQTLNLTNNAAEPLTDISAKIQGSSFRLKHNCPSVLNAGETCHAKITFRATREGYHTGRLTVYTSAKNYIVDLSGYGDRDPIDDVVPQPPIPPFPPR